jgi:hypothetical protein
MTTYHPYNVSLVLGSQAEACTREVDISDGREPNIGVFTDIGGIEDIDVTVSQNIVGCKICYVCSHVRCHHARATD